MIIKSNLLQVLIIIISLILTVLSIKTMHPFLWSITLILYFLSALLFHYQWKEGKRKDYLFELREKLLHIKAANPGKTNGLGMGLWAHSYYLQVVAKEFTSEEISELRKLNLFTDDEIDNLDKIITHYNSL